MAGRSTAPSAEPVPLLAAQRESWRRGACPETVEIVPGVWAIAVPCAMFPVRFTYAYLVVEGADALLIDPGLDTPAGLTALEDGLAVAGIGIGGVTGILVTHFHPDHLGMAARVRGLSGARIVLHAEEARMVGALTTRSARASLEAERDWLVAVGADAAALAAVHAPSATTTATAQWLRAQICRADDVVADGEEIVVGRRRLRVVHTPGHTAGHVCLVDEQRSLLFTGDHVLPKVHPNVGVHAGSGDADPVGDYLASLEGLRRFDGCTVLPAHEYAFLGLDARIDALVAHHDARQRTVREVLRVRGEGTVTDVAAELTWSRPWGDFGAVDRRLALATTFAHLRRLQARGQVAVAPDAARYRLVG